MRTLWAILLGGLALIGTAEARLGESYEVIKGRVGDLKLEADREYPLELIEARCRGIGGFDVIVFTFFREKGRSGSHITTSDISGKCVGVYFGRFYENWDEVEMTPKDVGALLAKNFPDSSTNMEIVESSGISGDIATNRLWSVKWRGVNGELAMGGVKPSSNYEPTFSVMFWSAELNTFYDKKADAEDKAKEQKRQRAMDAL